MNEKMNMLLESLKNLEQKHGDEIRTLQTEVAKLNAKVVKRDEAQLPLFRFKILLDFVKKIDKVIGINKDEGKGKVKDKHDTDKKNDPHHSTKR